MSAFSIFIIYFLIVFYGRVASISILSQLPLLFFLVILARDLLGKSKPIYYIFTAIFFLCVVLSALINQVSWVNVIIFLGINSAAFAAWNVMRIQHPSSYNAIRCWIATTIVLGSTFAIVQKSYVKSPDFVRGLFINLGNGAHVFTAITILYIAAIYFYPRILPDAFLKPLRRLCLTVYCLYSASLSDGKQVFLVLVISLLFPLVKYLIRNRSSIKGRLRLIVTTSAIVFIIYWGYTYGYLKIGWLDQPNLIFLGLELKFYIFEIIGKVNDTALGFFFGAGPGMVSSRLALMLPDYARLLDPSFITISPLTDKILYFQESNYVTNTSTGSSLFSLTFSLAAFVGEVGVLGTSFYLLALFKIINSLRTLRTEYFSLFFCAYYIILGVVYQYWEEPIFVYFAFMIYAAIFLHERRQ